MAPPPVRSIVLGGLLAAVTLVPITGIGAAPEQPAPVPELQQLREENAAMRERLTRLEAEIPHLQEGAQTGVEALNRQVDQRFDSMDGRLHLYMQVGTFVLILIGVFGFGYIHQILKGSVESTLRNHLRSPKFLASLNRKVAAAAEEARDSIMEASKEETRQLTRRLIDEFLVEERVRIKDTIQDEQEALKALRREHVALRFPVTKKVEANLARVGSAVQERSFELLTDEELHYAMLDAKGQSELPQAEAYARELVRRHPADPQPLADLACILERAERLAEAGELYGKAVELSPDSEELLSYYAEVLLADGKSDQARELFRGALGREPGHPGVSARFGTFLTRLGHPGEAEAVLRASLGYHPDHPGLLAAFEQACLRPDNAEPPGAA